MEPVTDGHRSVVLLGPPGAGKGTLARRLAGEWGFVHVDMGEILRTRSGRGDPVGRQIAKAQDRGAMVPKELVLQTLSDHLDGLDRARPLLLDGFPRTTAQVAAADDGRVPLVISAAVWLDVPVGLAADRLRARRGRGARRDDDPAVVRHRMDLVAETVDAVRALYEARGLLEVVDGTASPDEVFAEAALKLGLVATSG